jgi:FKBP12-rapamycin complex-associated protein
MEIGKMHPQAMIYPLTVASKSSSVARKSAALAIMEGMRQHSFDIVEQVRSSCLVQLHAHPLQALLVSHELIRVAILWHELWHEGLEEASRFYFTEKNPDGMIAVLEPLHDMLEAVRALFSALMFAYRPVHQGATTQRETSFAQVFGRDLHEARDACRRFRVYGEVHELDRAWDIYYGVRDARQTH